MFSSVSLESDAASLEFLEDFTLALAFPPFLDLGVELLETLGSFDSFSGVLFFSSSRSAKKSLTLSRTSF